MLHRGLRREMLRRFSVVISSLVAVFWTNLNSKFQKNRIPKDTIFLFNFSCR